MREKLRIIRECSYLSFKARFVWLKPEFYVAAKLISPFFQMAFFALVARYARGEEAMTYVALGNAVQVVAVNAIMGVSMVIGLERVFGMLPTLLVTPANRLLMFTSQTMFQVLDGMVSAMICLLFGWMFFGVELSEIDWLTFLPLLLFVTVSVAGIGVFVGAIGMVSQNVMPIMNLVYLLLLFLCGVNVPVAELPVWLQPISAALPLTYGIQAIRECVEGMFLSDLIVPYVIPMLSLGLLFYLSGTILINRFERKSRILGNLEKL